MIFRTNHCPRNQYRSQTSSDWYSCASFLLWSGQAIGCQNVSNNICFFCMATWKTPLLGLTKSFKMTDKNCSCCLRLNVSQLTTWYFVGILWNETNDNRKTSFHSIQYNSCVPNIDKISGSLIQNIKQITIFCPSFNYWKFRPQNKSEDNTLFWGWKLIKMLFK